MEIQEFVSAGKLIEGMDPKFSQQTPDILSNEPKKSDKMFRRAFEAGT